MIHAWYTDRMVLSIHDHDADLGAFKVASISSRGPLWNVDRGEVHQEKNGLCHSVNSLKMPMCNWSCISCPAVQPPHLINITIILIMLWVSSQPPLELMVPIKREICWHLDVKRRGRRGGVSCTRLLRAAGERWAAGEGTTRQGPLWWWKLFLQLPSHSFVCFIKQLQMLRWFTALIWRFHLGALRSDYLSYQGFNDDTELHPLLC